MRGQSGLESFMMLAVALAFVAGAFIIASSYSAEGINAAQAQDAVDRMSAAADHVYSLGQGSKEYADVQFPSSIQTLDVSNKKISIASTDGKNAFAPTNANIVNAVPGTPGPHHVFVQYLPDGNVLLGEEGLSCLPQEIALSLRPGSSANATFSVTNALPSSVGKVNATLNGGAALFGNITAYPPTTLTSGQAAAVNVTFGAPPQQASGIVGGEALVSSDNGTCMARFSISIQGDLSCASLCAGNGYLNGACMATPMACILAKYDYNSSLDSACQAAAPRCCCYPTTDNKGPLVASLAVSPNNASTTDMMNFSATCNDTSTGNSYISGAVYSLDGGAWNSMLPSGGAYNQSTVLQVSAQFTGLPFPGQHIIEAQCTDSANNTGPAKRVFFNVTAPDLLGPIVTFFNASGNGTMGTTVFFTGHASDSFTGSSNISACYVAIDPIVNNPNPNNTAFQAATPLDGAFNSPEEDFNFSATNLAIKWHSALVFCTDSRNNTGGMMNFSFGVKASDIMVILDQSGSMATAYTAVLANNSGENSDNYTFGFNNAKNGTPFTYPYSTTAVSTSNSAWTLAKSITVNSVAGANATLLVEGMVSNANCVGGYLVNSTQNKSMATWTTTGTSYAYLSSTIPVSQYAFPLVLNLYYNKTASNGNCKANHLVYARNFSMISATPMYWLKNMQLAYKDGNNSNFSLAAFVTENLTARNCTGYFELRSGANVVASGSTNSASNTIITVAGDLTGAAIPATLDLYGSTNSTSCSLNVSTMNISRAQDYQKLLSVYFTPLLGSSATVYFNGKVADAQGAACTGQYQARVNGTAVYSPTTASTTYAALSSSVNFGAYASPVTLDLYGRSSASPGCEAYATNLSIQQAGTKLSVALGAAKMFIDTMDNTTQAGVVNYSTVATILTPPTGQLHLMDSANKTSLKNAMGAIRATLNTCIECGLDTAADELSSARGRYNSSNSTAMRVSVLLTDGQGNVGTSLNGAYYSQARNITVYTIGYGTDVDELELRGIASLTGGKYYFAPDASTLQYIFTHIGQ